jgi:hypothetical protein
MAAAVLCGRRAAAALVLVVVHVLGLAVGAKAIAAAMPLAQVDTPIGETIGFQVHSYNDLREWPQLFTKWPPGAQPRYLKIDPNYQTQPFCQRVLNDSDPRGCFPLNHDSPSVDRKYFSLWDVLALLSSPAFAPYVGPGSRGAHIALCWYSVPGPCDGSPAAADWLSLVDEFVANASSLIASRALNLEFIMDGQGKPTKDCLMQRWRPWNSTYIQPSDPPAAFFSNNVSLAYDRFQVFNDMWKVLPMGAALDWGKFVNSRYPLLTWEPSEQHDINATAFVYFSRRIVHEPGFLFAINSDPVMFELYSAPASQRATNLRPSNLLAASQAVTAQLAVSCASSPALLVVYRRDDEPNALLYDVLDAVSGAPYVASAPLSLAGGFNVSANLTAASAACSSDCLVLLQWSDGSFVVLSVVDSAVTSSQGRLGSPRARHGQVCSFALKELAAGSFAESSAAGAGSLFSSSVAPTGGSIAAVAFSNGTCVGVMLWSLALGAPQTDVLCVANDSISANATHVSVVLVDGDDGATVFVSCATVAKTLFAAAVAVSSDLSRLLCLSGAEPCAVALGVGDRLALSASAPTDDSGWVLGVAGDSYCFNCEPHNKRAAIAACDQTPSPTPWVLTYSLAPVDVWVQRLTQGLPVSSCAADGSMHGAYDQGSAPDAEIFFDGPSGAVRVAAVHRGLDPELETGNECGDPVPFSGLVFDGWIVI